MLWRNGYHVDSFYGINEHQSELYTDKDEVLITMDFNTLICTFENLTKKLRKVHKFNMGVFKDYVVLVVSFGVQWRPESLRGEVRIIEQSWE